jgi:hypothetical protein
LQEAREEVDTFLGGVLLNYERLFKQIGSTNYNQLIKTMYSQNANSQAHIAGYQPACQRKACQLELPSRAFQLPSISATALGQSQSVPGSSLLTVSKLDISKSESGSMRTKDLSSTSQTVVATPRVAVKSRETQIMLRLNKIAPSSLRIRKMKNPKSSTLHGSNKRDNSHASLKNTQRPQMIVSIDLEPSKLAPAPSQNVI